MITSTKDPRDGDISRVSQFKILNRENVEIEAGWLAV